MDKNQVFPFVVGSPRSGTSLLRVMLDSHPGLAIPWESHFIPSSVGSPAELVRTLEADEKFQRWNVPLTGVEEAQTYADGVREVYARFAASQGKSRYGDKTPAYSLHVPLLAELFPEARFVHIVRDGRNVAPSIVEAGFTRSFEDAVLMWRRFASASRLAGKRLPGRYLEVSYEQLIDQPETTLRTLCQFIDMSFHPAMLAYPERIERIMPDLPQSDHLRHAPTRTRHWQRQLTPEQLHEFEKLAGDTLVAFGYELATSRSWRQSYERVRTRGSYLRARRRAAASLS